MRDFMTPDLEALFAVSDHISVFVWEQSPGWPVLRCTDNVKQLLGYEKEDFYQRRVKFIDTVHPADVERVSAEVNEALENKVKRTFTHLDYRMVRADGQIIWIADTTVLDCDEHGKVRFLTGYLLDITERKNLELALRAERTHLAMVLEGTRLGSWEWNPITDELAVNQRWLVMYGYHDQTTHKKMPFWRSLIHPDDVQGWELALHKHLYGNQPFYEHVYRMRHRNGQWLHILDRGKVVEWDNRRQSIRFCGTHTDITAQKNAEIEAKNTARSRAVFLANMSHEIRTPLHGILGLASVLEETNLSDYQRNLLRTMQESGDYLLNTLNDAIDISRADEGKLQIVRKPCELADICNYLRTVFEGQARRKGIEYSVKTEALPECIVIDKSRFLQVATNLVSNAFKFTQVGFVEVVLSWSASQLRLQVRDSGIGIADTERVWEIFEQEENVIERAEGGSGLGLSIVQTLVELMDGRATVDSALGRGSCFKVDIPAKPCEISIRKPAPPVQLPVLRILIIDDSDVNQLLLGEMLSALGQVYLSASSAEMGLELIQDEVFDVIFMDIHLPDIDGIEATRRIRQEPQAQPYIVGLTANATPAVKEKGLKAGMNAYLTKPFTQQHIQQVISGVTVVNFK